MKNNEIDQGESFRDAKRDDRPAQVSRGWAPGNYQRSCIHCGDRFIGDKRAPICADCAYEVPSHD